MPTGMSSQSFHWRSATFSLPSSAITANLGAMFLGSLAMMFLYGLATLQTYFYFNHYPNDNLSLKFWPGFLWALDTLHVILASHGMYHYLVLSFGIMENFSHIIWSLLSSLAVNLLLTTTVQIYFIQRIYILCSLRYRTMVVTALTFSACAHFAFTIELIALILVNHTQVSGLQGYSYKAVLPLGISNVLSNVLITLVLCILLRSNRNDFVDTNRLVNTLVIYAINRCVLVSLVPIAELFVFTFDSNPFYTFALDLVVGKLSVNSLLATLNLRRTISDYADDHYHIDRHEQQMSGLVFQARTMNTNKEMESTTNSLRQGSEFESAAAPAATSMSLQLT